MARIEIPFNGPAYADEIPFLNAQECVNYYLEKYPSANGDKYVLRGSPGLTEWFNTQYRGSIRGMISMGDYLYAAVWDRMFRIDENGTGSECTGNFLSYDDSRISMAENGNYVMAVDGDYGYTIQNGTTTLSQISDSGFPGGDMVTIQDGFFVVNRPGTGQFNKSALNDPTSWVALDFSTAAWKPDNLVGVLSAWRNLLLFGKKSREVWYNRGGEAGSSFPFFRREGTEIEIGCSATHSIAIVNDIVFWLAEDEHGDGQVFMDTGFSPRNITTPAIARHIHGYSTISDAIGFGYQLGNHIFYQLTFPTADATWVYDATEQQWHERQSWNRDSTPWKLGRHRAQSYAFFKGKHLIGDMSNGKIYEMKSDVYDEDGIEMPAIRTTYGINKDQRPITINEVQLLFTPGQGLISGQGSDPKTILSWSYTGGIKWGNEVQPDLGKIGEYYNRCIWWQLGQGRNFAIRLKTTDPVNRDIWGAYADMEVDDA